MASKGRPSMGPRVKFEVRFTPELAEKLRVAADERDLPMNRLVTKAVEEFIERLIPVEEWKMTR